MEAWDHGQAEGRDDCVTEITDAIVVTFGRVFDAGLRAQGRGRVALDESTRAIRPEPEHGDPP